MDSMQDILAKRSQPEPPEIAVIKEYVQKLYQKDVGVSLQQHSITITTPSAALAGSLRPHLHRIKQELATDKKLFIRIA